MLTRPCQAWPLARSTVAAHLRAVAIFAAVDGDPALSLGPEGTLTVPVWVIALVGGLAFVVAVAALVYRMRGDGRR